MKRTGFKFTTIVFLLVLGTAGLYAQKADVYVDKKGVMRWGDSKEEVHAFGVNYTAMFAHAYRAAKQLNIPLEKAIDDDIYHFARLGFDAYRVHVWDCEISDSVGNLLSNEHLRLFDYALHKMKERGMKFVITPIAYWPNGYPEPPEKTPGFATKYGKEDCLTNPEAIKAQENYLYQFLNHVNEYTGIAYKSDPAIIAFEVSNEPHHGEAPEKVTSFINRMVTSMRRTGCKKPIFYNISHSIHLADAYFGASIQGGTFQWYPTGLGAQRELGGNLLPNVEKYTIPFADHPKFKKMAKLVYEFDAADVGRSYLYPAMARGFREAGMQVATHFAYDPTYMAYANTEYNTHYMNLAYAPQKALSLAIASEVFHTIPLYQDFGKYPQNLSFGPFRVSYENDLAEMLTATKFLYTNHTTHTFPSPETLEQIAGFGNSSVVAYEGQGAYFLDRIEKGVWRLEVMPDALWIGNVFGHNSLKKEVAVINWRKWPMMVQLPDLGDRFTITGINDGNTYTSTAAGKKFTIAPGTYLLIKDGTTSRRKGEERWKNIKLKEFSAPATTLKNTYVVHDPVSEVTAGKSLTIEATIVSREEPRAVEVSVFGGGWRPGILTMERVIGYTYRATVPEKLVKEGFLKYYISVKEGEDFYTYPSGVEGHPRDWDFFADDPYTMRVVHPASPVFLFDALTDADAVSGQGRASTVVPSNNPGKAELQVRVEKLAVPDPENRNAPKIFDHSMRYYFGHKLKGRQDDLTAMRDIVLQGHSLTGKPFKLQIALVMKDGSAYGGSIEVGVEKKDYRISLSDLKDVKLVSLPRPYPGFLPYYFKTETLCDFDLRATETLQISIGPGILESELTDRYGVGIESVRLE